MGFVGDHWRNGKKWKPKPKNETAIQQDCKTEYNGISVGIPPIPSECFFVFSALFSRKRECYCVGAHSSREMRNRQRRFGAAYDSGAKPGLRIPLYIPSRIQIPANQQHKIVSSRTINDVSVCAQNKTADKCAVAKATAHLFFFCLTNWDLSGSYVEG